MFNNLNCPCYCQVDFWSVYKHTLYCYFVGISPNIIINTAGEGLPFGSFGCLYFYLWAVFFYTLASAPSRLMLVLFFCSRCTASFFGHILDEPLRFSRTTNTQVSSVLNMYRYKSRWKLLNKMHKIWLRTSCNGLLHSMLQNRLRVIRLWLIHELPLQSNIDHKQFFVECHIVSDADLSHRKVFILIKDTLANCV